MNRSNEHNRAYVPQQNSHHSQHRGYAPQPQPQSEDNMPNNQYYEQQNNEHTPQYSEQQNTHYAPSYPAQEQENQHERQQDFDPNHAPGGKFYSIKVHGGSAAVEIKADVTRKGFKTIRVESAKGANKKFNWDQKVSLQLTATGLIEFLNAFLLIKAEIELKHYGVNNDKSLKVSFQKDKLFVQVSQKGSGFIGTPVPMLDVIRIGQFALDQYLKNYENLSADVVISHLKRAVQVVG
ncbi:MAG: hypothetical protein ACTJFX_08585 [Pseudoalteromonas prydzensis]